MSGLWVVSGMRHEWAVGGEMDEWALSVEKRDECAE